jgi:UDP-N-acetylmuramate dehydrogenase
VLFFYLPKSLGYTYCMKILENIALAEYTTFRIGGRARCFCEVESEADLAEAIRFSREKGLPLFVLGGGSNVLVSDDGFAGLVVRMKIGGAAFTERSDDVLVEAGAGEGWDALVEQAVLKGYWGLENLSAIPGTVGAAPVQNIGAYGVEVKDLVESVRAVDRETGAARTFSNAECRFAYRESWFKTNEGARWIIVSVALRLSKTPRPNLSYKDLSEHFSKALLSGTAPTLVQIRAAVIAIRASKFPDLSKTGKAGTAGSFWKNPIIPRAQFDALAARFPGIPSYPADAPAGSRPVSAADDRVKIPLAWILDRVCGLKGFALGRAALWKSQPLILCAEPGATSADVRALADHVAQSVKEKTGIDIEPEVRFLD